MSFGDTYDPGGVPSNVGGYPVIVAAAVPPSPIKGMAWMDSTKNELSVFDGANWVVITGGSAVGLPTATKADQIIVSAQTTPFNWIAADLDAGRY